MTLNIQKRKVRYKGLSIQTYSIGTGSQNILALPAFPHSGVVYWNIVRYWDLERFTIITFDIPGWIGASDNLFALKQFTIEDCADIALHVLKAYEVSRYSILGMSFGTTIETVLAEYDSERIDRMAFISPLINCNYAVLDGNKAMSELMYKVNGHKLVKWYVLMRYKKLYVPTLLKLGAEKEFLDEYEELMHNASSHTLLQSLYVLFHANYSLYVRKLAHKPILVVNSRTENPMFKLSARLIRQYVQNKESLFLQGRHEDIVLKPDQKILKKIENFFAEA